MLISVIIELNILPHIEQIKILSWSISILSKVSSALGLSLAIGFFTEKIKISKNSIKNMTNEDKQELIQQIITDENDLSKYKQKNILDIFNYNSSIKLNVKYSVSVFVDEKSGCVCAETLQSYVIQQGKEKKITNSIYFDNEKSNIQYFKFSNPNDTNDFEKVEQIHVEKCQAFGENFEYNNYCYVPKKYLAMDNICVESKYTFYGKEHWISYGVMLQNPTNGIDFELTAKDGLTVKEVMIFEDTNLYSEIKEANKVHISSTQWLSNYSGFTIIIGK